ncbi:hypothetical protein ATE40_011170 [Serratia surfactantfaciens]|nr:hypothetical protein ATE40_011170 [Serratia surfactantfaciens]
MRPHALSPGAVERFLIIERLRMFGFTAFGKPFAAWQNIMPSVHVPRILTKPGSRPMRLNEQTILIIKRHDILTAKRTIRRSP